MHIHSIPILFSLKNKKIRTVLNFKYEDSKYHYHFFIFLETSQFPKSKISSLGKKKNKNYSAKEHPLLKTPRRQRIQSAPK